MLHYLVKRSTVTTAVTYWSRCYLYYEFSDVFYH